MSERRHHVKRTIAAMEPLTFDKGRVSITLERGFGVTARVTIRVDGVEVIRRLAINERQAFDGGRIAVELERTFGHKARLYLNLADDVRIDKPEQAVPTAEKPPAPAFGGYL